MTNPGFAVQDAMVRRRDFDADTIVRTTLFLAVFLLMWISVHPFSSLAEAPALTSEGGDRLNQIAFAGLFSIFAAWVYFVHPFGLKPLFRPALIAMLAWFALSIVLSWDPSLSLRRFAFAIVMLGLASITLLLPKNLRHFCDLMAAVTVIVLSLCYFGVIFIPENAIHQLTDYLEPEHAGSWRGIFPHKNQAGAMMVVFALVGLFVARVRSRGLGALIVVSSLLFLAFTRSKTPIGLLPIALIVSSIVIHTRRPMLGVTVAIATLIMLNALTVGSVFVDPIRDFLDLVIADSSFTGRTDIWKFAIGELMNRPITGFGFGAFWGTEQVVFGLSESMTWATSATDAHNGYLNVALTTGVPGLLLAATWIAVLPVMDYYRHGDDEGSRQMAILFVRIAVFGIYMSVFEGTLFQQAGEFWFILTVAIFGLRYLSLARVAP
jgi:O-antigen ligase